MASPPALSLGTENGGGRRDWGVRESQPRVQILMGALNNSATLVPFSLSGPQFPDLEEGAVMPPPAQECWENMK